MNVQSVLQEKVNIHFLKMLAFAFEGITSLSVKLIRFITLAGFLMIFVAILGFYIAY